jgi:WS/DGAT/MGAT family acyltransferase
MADRLSPLDVSFLYLEDSTTPMHVGAVSVFETPQGFDVDGMVDHVRRRIAFVPRYRQRIRWVPGHLASPVWVDDEDFDVAYHVRRVTLPPPGDDEQLHALVASVMSRPLDRDRPLWETYVVEGLSGGRFALVTKTHHAVVDGVSAVDIGQVLLDVTPEPRLAPVDTWRPTPGPSGAELVVGAVSDWVRRPSVLVDALRVGVGDVRRAAGRLVGASAGVLAMALTVSRSAPGNALNTDIGRQRRYTTVDASLDDFRAIRKTHGGTVNDVVLAVVAGALREWLVMRGDPVGQGTAVRALVPVSVRADGGGDPPGALGGRVASYLVDLPVGEANPVVRLHQISYAMKAHQDSGQAIGAEALVGVASFTPPTLHLLGARVTNTLSRRLFNVVVTNVPGPQLTLYADGARMLAAYPVVPLARGQSVSIGLTSYDGAIHIGLNADRDSMPDLDVLAGALRDSLNELLGTVR